MSDTTDNPYKDYKTFYQNGKDCYQHLGFEVHLDKNSNDGVLNTYKNLIKG